MPQETCHRQLGAEAGWTIAVQQPAIGVTESSVFQYRLNNTDIERDLVYLDFCLCNGTRELLNEDATTVTVNGAPVGRNIIFNQAGSTIDCEGTVMRINPDQNIEGGEVIVTITFTQPLEVISGEIGINSTGGDPDNWSDICVFGCPSPTPPPVTPSRKIML